MKLFFVANVFTLCFLLSNTLSANEGNWEYKAKTIPLLQDDNISSSINAMAKDKWAFINCTQKTGGKILCFFRKPKA